VAFAIPKRGLGYRLSLDGVAARISNKTLNSKRQISNKIKIPIFKLFCKFSVYFFRFTFHFTRFTPLPLSCGPLAILSLFFNTFNCPQLLPIAFFNHPISPFFKGGVRGIFAFLSTLYLLLYLKSITFSFFLNPSVSNRMR